MSKGQWNTTAPSWASGYNNSFQTTGSAGTMTYTFSPTIDLSGYTNDTLKVYWGSTSNRPLKVGINGGADTQIDAVSASADRSQVRVATTTLSVTSISSLKFISSGGGNVFIFKIEIVGIGGSGPTPPPTPTLSNDATLSDLKVNGTTIQNFSAGTTSYNYTVAAGVTTIPTVSATANHASAQVAITQASSVTGQASVLVTAEDGTSQQTYTVQFLQSGDTPPTPPTPPTPTPTNLTLHETETYETPVVLGGYGGTLATFGNREYEVFYINRDAAGSNLSVSLVNSDKNNGITTGTSAIQCAANDGWLTAKGAGNSSATDNVGEEFGSMVRRLDMQEGDSIVMHIKGYSEFAMVAADKKKDTSSGHSESC